MKDDRTPSELLDHIGDIIRERQQKSLPTFFTLSIEQYEKNTPVAEKEEGYDNFKKLILKYMTDYNLTGITIQLFSGKSRKVKTPFQVFKVALKKQNPTLTLGNTNDEVPEVQQLENGISVHRYYDEKFELQMRIMRTEMEKQTLVEQVSRITEKYEEKIKDLEQANKELQEEIDEHENEINRIEKSKHNSLGNVALGSVGSHLLEKFVGSKIGLSLLESVLGKESLEGLKGTLSGTNTEALESPQKETARIISEPETKDPRSIALAYIQKIGLGLQDVTLKLLYDLTEIIANNGQELQIIYSVVQQLKAKRNDIKTENKTTENESEKTNNAGDGESSTENSKTKL